MQLVRLSGGGWINPEHISAMTPVTTDGGGTAYRLVIGADTTVITQEEAEDIAKATEEAHRDISRLTSAIRELKELLRARMR